MATHIAKLTVSLGLSAAEYVTGLQTSERQARQFAQQIDRGIKTAVNLATIALAGMTTAATAAFIAVDQLVKQAGNFQDLAEKTGANAEALASFSIAAQVAGANIEEVANFSIKLSKNLAGVDDESKAAGAALTALGIPIKQFKALKPEEQIERLAKALAGFSDIGTGKTAALEAIAKGGAQLLPFLKELEQQGGRQVILTKEQIRQADEYADKQARAKAELNLYAQALAINTLPAINAVTKATIEFIKSLAGVEAGSNALQANNVIELWAERTAKSIAFVVDAFDSLTRIGQEGFIFGKAMLDQADAFALKDFGRIKAIGEAWKKEAQEILMRPLFSAKVDAEFEALRRNRSLNQADLFAGGNASGGLPTLTLSGADGKAARAAAERTSEAQRYVESLQKQLEKTQELTVAEQLWLDFSLGRIKGMTAARFAEADAFARQIDAAKVAKQIADDQRRSEDEASRIRAQISQQTTRDIIAEQNEAQAMRDSNDVIKESIAFAKGGEQAMLALRDARLADTIAAMDNKLATALTAEASAGMVKAIQEQVAALKQKQALYGQLNIAEQMAKDARALQAAQESLFDIGATAIDRLTESGAKASDVLRALEKDIMRFLTQQALMGLKNSVFGGPSTGTDIWSIIAKLGMSYLTGGASGAISATSGGVGYELGSLAGGTDNWRGGLSWVGEHGPELLNLPRGAQVMSNHDVRSIGQERSIQVINHTTVMPGASYASVMQAKREIAQATVHSIKNRN